MKKQANWCVYILHCSDKSLYTGITTDLDNRLKQHNLGKASKYTRSRTPVKIIWIENGHNESSAKKREFEIKKLSRKEKLTLSSTTTT
jgi:putative endonuclease